MVEEVLLHGFTITHVLDRLADPAKNRVIAEFSDNAAAVFPYLNATVPNLMYNPGANTVTVRRGERSPTFHPPVKKCAGAGSGLDRPRRVCYNVNQCGLI